MIKKFKDFINENNEVVDYVWLDPFSGVKHKTKCKVIGPTKSGKRIEIELLGFGRNNTPPKTRMKVLPKNLIGYKPEKEVDGSWKNYTYFD